MKKLFLILLTSLGLMLFSCKKKALENMTVVRDCTGTYLRIDRKDYRVCNLEKLTTYNDGVIVKAKFHKLKECNGSGMNQIVCMMYHQHEGWIEVTEVK